MRRPFALLAFAALAFGAAVSLVHDYRLQDFDCLRTAAALVLGGGDPYDPATWLRATGYPQTSCLGERFAYPLWTALLAVPFALIPYPWTAAAWVALTAFATILGATLVFRTVGGDTRRLPLLLTIVLASQPFVTVVRAGQIDGLALGGLGAVAWAMSRRREAAAGALLGLLLAKPQLVAVTLPFFALRAVLTGRTPLVLGLAASAAALTALSWIARPGWLGEWSTEILGPRLRVAPLLATIWGFAADFVGDARAGAILALLLGLGLLLALRNRRVSDADALVVSTALSLAIAPHVWSYDHLLLVPGVALLLARVRSPQALAAIALLGTALPWALYAVALARGSESLSVLVPIAAVFAVALGLPAQAGRSTTR